MARTRSTPRRQTSERRDQILAIAAGLFARRGYAATTVRDIADEAGILSGSLYHHFASKEEILQEILRGFLAELTEGFELIVAEGGPPGTVVDALIAYAFEMAEREPDAVRLVHREAAILATHPRFEFVRDYGRRIEELWLSPLREGQRVGVFRDTWDIGIAYRFIRDAVLSSVGWSRFDDGGKDSNVAETVLELLRHGMLSA